MDMCGFPKDNYFYYQAWWGTKPVLHLFPHWNWEGKEGEEISVWCHTNLDRVELLLNGKSLGAKHVVKNSHLEWKVNYAPGVIEARGFKDAKLALTTRRETAGTPSAVVLAADRGRIAAGGQDLSVLAAKIVDQAGRVVPMAMNDLHFEISGPGRLIGFGNGNPSCHQPDKPESFTAGTRSAFNGLCMALVQALNDAGNVQVLASSKGLSTGSVAIKVA
jgi:beta-galactosidase